MSDAVLGVLRPGLLERGYSVEVSKTRGDRVRRPVLFGPQGVERISCTAGRGAMSKAVW